MSSSDLAVRIRGLSKAYTIAHNRQRATNLPEAVAQRLRHPFRRSEKETFWALKDIDLDIRKGEVVGVIGRNGAGKSTLLKVLSRITEPTAGQIDLFGRVGSLLEVGTGFHPELTGQENIYLNGAILGMRRDEIRRQFDAIVDFAGVEQFLDTPVKRYSSGMYVRLAFAVAAHLNPEILIVDEVLAVGDAEFQKKCLGKMQAVAHEGRTVLFVSHNMAAIRALTSRAIFLSHGKVQTAGPTATVAKNYTDKIEASFNRTEKFCMPKSSVEGNVKVTRVCLVDGVKNRSYVCMGSEIEFEIECTALNPASINLGISINRLDGERVVSLSTSYHNAAIPVEGTVIINCYAEKLPLLSGKYFARCVIADTQNSIISDYPEALAFEIGPHDVFGTGRYPDTHQGKIFWPSSWRSSGSTCLKNC